MMKKLFQVNPFCVVLFFLFIGLFLTSPFYYHKMFSQLQSQPQPTVVKIKVESRYEEQWQGTGVFVADDLILTAGHIVEDANEILIIWPDDKKHLAVSWYQETEADLGLIYIRTLEIESVAKFDDAIVGETVRVIGGPYGYFPVITQGIISAVNIVDDFAGGKNVFITDCPLVPGNSGSPIFDKDNNILGIFSWHYLNEEGMNFCVPSRICQLMLNKYRAIQELEGVE